MASPFCKLCDSLFFAYKPEHLSLLFFSFFSFLSCYSATIWQPVNLETNQNKWQDKHVVVSFRGRFSFLFFKRLHVSSQWQGKGIRRLTSLDFVKCYQIEKKNNVKEAISLTGTIWSKQTKVFHFQNITFLTEVCVRKVCVQKTSWVISIYQQGQIDNVSRPGKGCDTGVTLNGSSWDFEK